MAPTLNENQVGSITSQILSLPDVPLYKGVAPILVKNWVGSRVSDSEAGHLLELVQIQTVTRREAKKAAQNENPLVDNISIGLLDQILQSQGTDLLYTRLKKELCTSQIGHLSQKSRLNQGTSREGYTLNKQGLLCYKGRALVPTQKAIIQELLYLYYDDQFAGHWGINKTKELLERKFYWPGMDTDIREYVTTCSVCQNVTRLPFLGTSYMANLSH